jgi:hypothetical protein
VLSIILQGATGNECTRVQSDSVIAGKINSFKKNLQKPSSGDK